MHPVYPRYLYARAKHASFFLPVIATFAEWSNEADAACGWSFICFNILLRASNSFILNMWQFYSLDVLMPFLYSESQIKLYPNSPCVLSFHPWYYLASLHQRLDICLTMRSAGEIIIIMTVAICLCERICFLIFKISFELFPFLCDYLRYCIFSSDMCQDLSL